VRTYLVTVMSIETWIDFLCSPSPSKWSCFNHTSSGFYKFLIERDIVCEIGDNVRKVGKSDSRAPNTGGSKP